jgi:hypothetical protein
MSSLPRHAQHIYYTQHSFARATAPEHIQYTATLVNNRACRLQTPKMHAVMLTMLLASESKRIENWVRC